MNVPYHAKKMNPNPERKLARELAASHLANGDPLGWFDLLYRQANGEAHLIPWADLQPNPHLTQWIGTLSAPPGRALVVGCGLGDDAECLASLGWSVEAFDISHQAIQWAKKRFPDTHVQYQTTDLFSPPPRWHHHFDLVVEIYTLQVLPPPLRQQAIPLIADWVSPNGLLFVAARAREESDNPGQMPWPLTKIEIHSFEKTGLQSQSFTDYFDNEQPPVRRFRAIFSRPLHHDRSRPK